MSRFNECVLSIIFVFKIKENTPIIIIVFDKIIIILFHLIIVFLYSLNLILNVEFRLCTIFKKINDNLVDFNCKINTLSI